MVTAFLFPSFAAGIPELTLRGTVDPGTADYLVEGIRQAEAAGAPAVLIRLDTPGGLLESTRAIVRAELGSTVPVIVWVEPSGAHAGSAGVFVTLASHVAVMAPGTTIGAAHPVLVGGDSEVIEKKALEDAAAWARAIAAQRGRPEAWAEAAVRESVAATDAEALALGVIDVVASDPDALFATLDGRVVQTAAGPVTLRLADVPREPVPMSVPQRVAHVLGNPNFVFVALALGLLGIWTEIQSPGLILPGALGVVLVLAAAVGLSILPFNAAGLVLLLFGFALLAAEVFAGGHGLFAIGGGLSVLLGGSLLFDAPGLGVDRGLLVGTAVVVSLSALGVAWLVARAHQRKVVTGAEGLVGSVALVLVGGEGEGRVRVAGEDWLATWKGSTKAGDRVRVRAVRDLVLETEEMS